MYLQYELVLLFAKSMVLDNHIYILVSIDYYLQLVLNKPN
nr:MAG TPA: hypothetical protein [Caudoviricetes sp.]